jgi:hypothetical protein
MRGQPLSPPGAYVSAAHVYIKISAFYRFDAKGELVSERIVMNLAPLASPA